MSKLNAAITAVLGASGSGKSLYLKQSLARIKPGRLLIWDPQGEYGAFGEPVRHLEAVRKVLLAALSKERFALVFMEDKRGG